MKSIDREICKYKNELDGYLDLALRSLLQYSKKHNEILPNKVKRICIAVQREFDGFELATLIDEKGCPPKESK